MCGGKELASASESELMGEGVGVGVLDAEDEYSFISGGTIPEALIETIRKTNEM